MTIKIPIFEKYNKTNKKPLDLTYNYTFLINSDKCRDNFYVKFNGSFEILYNSHYLNYKPFDRSSNDIIHFNEDDYRPLIQSIDNYNIIKINTWATSSKTLYNYLARISIDYNSKDNNFRLRISIEDRNQDDQSVHHYVWIKLFNDVNCMFVNEYNHAFRWLRNNQPSLESLCVNFVAENQLACNYLPYFLRDSVNDLKSVLDIQKSFTHVWPY